MTVAAIFKSRFLKLAAARKNPISFNQVEVESKIKHSVNAYRYTSYGISTFLKKKKEGMRLKFYNAPLNAKLIFFFIIFIFFIQDGPWMTYALSVENLLTISYCLSLTCTIAKQLYYCLL